MYKKWVLSLLSNTLRVLSIGGILTVDFTKGISSLQNLISYIIRLRGDDILLLFPIQVEQMLDYRTFVELTMPYTNITNIDFISIGIRLRNLKLL